MFCVPGAWRDNVLQAFLGCKQRLLLFLPSLVHKEDCTRLVRRSPPQPRPMTRFGPESSVFRHTARLAADLLFLLPLFLLLLCLRLLQALVPPSSPLRAIVLEAVTVRLLGVHAGLAALRVPTASKHVQITRVLFSLVFSQCPPRRMERVRCEPLHTRDAPARSEADTTH